LLLATRQVLIARRRFRIGFQPFQLSASCNQRQDCHRSRISHNEYSARHPASSQLDGGSEGVPVDGQKCLYRPQTGHTDSQKSKSPVRKPASALAGSWWPRAELNHRHTDFLKAVVQSGSRYPGTSVLASRRRFFTAQRRQCRPDAPDQYGRLTVA
jgi:hypothetical protein